MATVGTDMLVYYQGLSLGTFSGSPVTLFRNVLPVTPDVCGAVFETNGLAPEGAFGRVGIAAETPGVQVRFRGVPNDEEGPSAQAQTAYLASFRQVITINGTLYRTLRPIQAPAILERDAKARVVWAFNVLAERELTA